MQRVGPGPLSNETVVNDGLIEGENEEREINDWRNKDLNKNQSGRE